MTPSPESCEIRAEDLRDGGLCPLCNHRGIEHQSGYQTGGVVPKPQMHSFVGGEHIQQGDTIAIRGEMAVRLLPGRHRRWMATNRRTSMGLGNTSLLGALRFAFDNLMSGHGLTRLWRIAR